MEGDFWMSDFNNFDEYNPYQTIYQSSIITTIQSTGDPVPKPCIWKLSRNHIHKGYHTKGDHPKGSHSQNHVYGNSPVTIYIKGTKPTGTIPRGTNPNDPLTSTARSELL